MPRVGSLDQTLPEIQFAYGEIQQTLGGEGITVQINDYGGFRTPADTSEILAYRATDYATALAAGKIPATLSLDAYRPIAPYGESYHDYGAALDLSPLAYPSSMTWGEAMDAIAQAATAAGLVQPLPSSDPAHFQLPLSLAAAQAEWNQYYGSGVAMLPAVVSTGVSPLVDVVIVAVVIGGVALLANRRRRSYRNG